MTAPASTESIGLREHRDEIIEHRNLEVVAPLGPTMGS